MRPVNRATSNTCTDRERERGGGGGENESSTVRERKRESTSKRGMGNLLNLFLLNLTHRRLSLMNTAPYSPCRHHKHNRYFHRQIYSRYRFL